MVRSPACSACRSSDGKAGAPRFCRPDGSRRHLMETATTTHIPGSPLWPQDGAHLQGRTFAKGRTIASGARRAMQRPCNGHADDMQSPGNWPDACFFTNLDARQCAPRQRRASDRRCLEPRIHSRDGVANGSRGNPRQRRYAQKRGSPLPARHRYLICAGPCRKRWRACAAYARTGNLGVR